MKLHRLNPKAFLMLSLVCSSLFNQGCAMEPLKLSQEMSLTTNLPKTIFKAPQWHSPEGQPSIFAPKNWSVTYDPHSQSFTIKGYLGHPGQEVDPTDAATFQGTLGQNDMQLVLIHSNQNITLTLPFAPNITGKTFIKGEKDLSPTQAARNFKSTLENFFAEYNAQPLPEIIPLQDFVVKEISIPDALGPRLWIGFKGTKPEDLEVQKVIYWANQGLIGGVILFGFNIENPQQLKELSAGLKSQGIKTIIVDGEGGRVKRLPDEKGFKNLPTARDLGKVPLEQAKPLYHAWAEQMARAGFNFNLAPVVDIDLNPESPGVGQYGRSFSVDPDLVISHARAFIQAMHEHGIFVCLKHFPGQGSAKTDTHLEITDITKTWDREKELSPYRAPVNEADAVMPGHLIHQQIDAENPATFSQVWHKILRQDIGFKGLTITDELGSMMKGLGDLPLPKRVLKALAAGNDILLIKDINSEQDLAQIYQAITEEVLSEKLSVEDLSQAKMRVAKALNKLTHGDS